MLVSGFDEIVDAIKYKTVVYMYAIKDTIATYHGFLFANNRLMTGNIPMDKPYVLCLKRQLTWLLKVNSVVLERDKPRRIYIIWYRMGLELPTRHTTSRELIQPRDYAYLQAANYRAMRDLTTPTVK